MSGIASEISTYCDVLGCPLTILSGIFFVTFGHLEWVQVHPVVSQSHGTADSAH